jgi:CheY-like chemotaxis protein
MMRILVVDDDKVMGEVFTVMLKRYGFEVAVACDGLMGIEMWEGGNFDVILMDVQMPRMDGFEATRAIREKEVARGSHIIIVAITAFALQEDEVKSLAAGMDAYMSKPVDFLKCIELIRELVLRRKEPASALTFNDM